MIDFNHEIRNFKPSSEVDDIEKIIAGMELTDMQDIVLGLMKESMAGQPEPARTADSYFEDDSK